MLQTKYLDSVKIVSVDYDALIKTLKRSTYAIKEKDPLVIKIFLFGSFTKGNFTPESDIDILIILKQTDRPFLQRRDQYFDFFKDIPFDCNILAYTEAEIKKMVQDNNLFIKNIIEEGLAL